MIEYFNGSQIDGTHCLVATSKHAWNNFRNGIQLQRIQTIANSEPFSTNSNHSENVLNFVQFKPIEN